MPFPWQYQELVDGKYSLNKKTAETTLNFEKEVQKFSVRLNKQNGEQKNSTKSAHFSAFRIVIILFFHFTEELNFVSLNPLLAVNVLGSATELFLFFNSELQKAIFLGKLSSGTSRKNLTVRHLAVELHIVSFLAATIDKIYSPFKETLKGNNVEKCSKMIKAHFDEHKKAVFAKIASVAEETIESEEKQTFQSGLDGDLSQNMKSFVRKLRYLKKNTFDYLGDLEQNNLQEVVHGAFERKIQTLIRKHKIEWGSADLNYLKEHFKMIWGSNDALEEMFAEF